MTFHGLPNMAQGPPIEVPGISKLGLRTGNVDPDTRETSSGSCRVAMPTLRYISLVLLPPGPS